MTKEQAAVTAGDRLAAIEAHARYTFYATTVGVGLLLVLTILALAGASDYLRMKSALAGLADGPLQGVTAASSASRTAFDR